MKLLFTCFGCKRKQKISYNKNVNCSNVKFTSMIISEGIMTNQVEPHIKTQKEKEKSQKNNIEKKDILINEEEDKKDKKIKDSLISNELEKDNKDNNNTNYSKLGLIVYYIY